MSDITEIKRSLENRAQEVAEHLLPNGRRDGRRWLAGSVQGEPGDSLRIELSGAKVGIWSDFAPGGESGDLIDLWQAVKGCPLPTALDAIRSWLGLERPKFEKQAKSWRRPSQPKAIPPQSAVLAYLANRKLSADTIRAYRIGEDGRTIVFPSHLPSGDLVGVKYLGVDRSPEGKKITRVEAGCEPVLFGWQAIDGNAREIVITEGEIDALSMWQYGFPALSVPFGGGRGAKQAWIESEFDRLQQFEVIHLALDMDQEGDAAADEIANRLGRHRCRRVKLPRKDANECLKAGISADEIRRCIESAESLDPPELRRAGEYADEVLKSFWPPDDVEPGYRMPIGKLRDKLVFRPGELTIWTGATGAGKSQLLSHAAVGWGDQSARVCIASLEMAPRQLLKRMVKQAGNVDRPTESYLRAIMGWLDHWLWVFAVTGKSPVARMLTVFEYARARHGCDVFVIDSLMRLGIRADDYDAQEKAVFEIVNWVVAKGVHLHLVAHARKADRNVGDVAGSEDVKGTSEIAANAFNVLSVWRNRGLEDELKQAAEEAERGSQAAHLKLADLADKPTVILNVAKQRNGDFEGKVGLWFSTETYQYRARDDARRGRNYVEFSEPVERFSIVAGGSQ